MKNKIKSFIKNLPSKLLAIQLIPDGFDPTESSSITNLINHIIEDIALPFVGIICIIFIIIGGIQLITSGGNPQGAEKAKTTLTWAVAGFILVLAAKLIIDYFKGLIIS